MPHMTCIECRCEYDPILLFCPECGSSESFEEYGENVYDEFINEDDLYDHSGSDDIILSDADS